MAMFGQDYERNPQTIFGAVVSRIKAAGEQKKQREQQDMENLWRLISVLPPASQRIILSNPKVRERLDKFYGLGQGQSGQPALPPRHPPIVRTLKQTTH